MNQTIPLTVRKLKPYGAAILLDPTGCSHPILLKPCKHIFFRLLRSELTSTLFKHHRLVASGSLGESYALECFSCHGNAPSAQFLMHLLIMVPSCTFSCLYSLDYTAYMYEIRTLCKQFKTSLCILVCPAFKIFSIDYTGYCLVVHCLYRHIVLQEAMSWLSTLGGGFSSLGDKYEDAAEIAGAISLRQMHLAIALKIPVFQARCRLFFATSLMQRGKLRACEAIIRSVYKFIMVASPYENPPEIHLHQMCLGLWSRLEYLWQLRRVKKKQKGHLNLTRADKQLLLSTEQDDCNTTTDHSILSGRRLFPDVTAILNRL